MTKTVRVPGAKTAREFGYSVHVHTQHHFSFRNANGIIHVWPKRFKVMHQPRSGPNGPVLMGRKALGELLRSHTEKPGVGECPLCNRKVRESGRVHHDKCLMIASYGERMVELYG